MDIQMVVRARKSLLNIGRLIADVEESAHIANTP